MHKETMKYDMSAESMYTTHMPLYMRTYLLIHSLIVHYYVHYISIGPTWVFCNALYLEVPYLQQRQPEGLCVSSWIGLTVSSPHLFIHPFSQDTTFNQLTNNIQSFIVM